MKLEHIGIAIRNKSEATELFSKLFNQQPVKEETVEREGVTTVFFVMENGAKIELLEATRPDSPIAKFIEKRGEGIHHLAFEVKDIRQELKRLQEAGFSLLSDEPKPGADNKEIVFLHPKSTGGILIELCQEKLF
ncbi:MAG: methylmalonyl-CoA epimerase [Bacteroidia bacterium]|nr:methylmalonyl-CoA epimerase [Bacteroidia bacterium]